MSRCKLMVLSIILSLVCASLPACQRRNLSFRQPNPSTVLVNPENLDDLPPNPQSGLPVEVPPPTNEEPQRPEGRFPVAMAGFFIDMDNIPAGPAYNVRRAAARIDGMVLRAGEVFSFNKLMEPYTSAAGWKDGASFVGGEVVASPGGGICKVATTLYNVAVLANLEILERRNHGLIVPYVNAGQDATVSTQSPDLKFRNTSAHPVMLKAAVDGNRLFIAAYGSELPPKISWHHVVTKREQPPIVIKENRKLSPGEDRVIRNGTEGMTVKSWVIIIYPDGRQVRKDMGTSVYAPLTRVVERAPEPMPEQSIPTMQASARMHVTSTK